MLVHLDEGTAAKRKEESPMLTGLSSFIEILVWAQENCAQTLSGVFKKWFVQPIGLVECSTNEIRVTRCCKHHANDDRVHCESGDDSGNHEGCEPQPKETEPAAASLIRREPDSHASVMSIFLRATDTDEAANLSPGWLVESIPFGGKREIDVRASLDAF